MTPELTPRGWCPLFFDYFHLGLTSALAFSPTDTRSMARWAKTAMGAQSLILGLVIARAVSIVALAHDPLFTPSCLPQSVTGSGARRAHERTG